MKLYWCLSIALCQEYGLFWRAPGRLSHVASPVANISMSLLSLLSIILSSKCNVLFAVVV